MLCTCWPLPRALHGQTHQKLPGSRPEGLDDNKSVRDLVWQLLSGYSSSGRTSLAYLHHGRGRGSPCATVLFVLLRGRMGQ
jgi:hypothetical protein